MQQNIIYTLVINTEPILYILFVLYTYEYIINIFFKYIFQIIINNVSDFTSIIPIYHTKLLLINIHSIFSVLCKNTISIRIVETK